MDLYLATALATATFASPRHSKTQRQVSPGTHIAVLALTGLEEPPTTCEVPLSSMAKSSPLTVCVRLQESLHRDNSISGEFLLRTHKIPHRRWAHPFKEGIFVAFTAHPHDSKCFHTVLNLQENQRLVAHLRTQPLQYTVLLNLHHRTQPSHRTVLLNLHHRTQPLHYTILNLLCHRTQP